MRASATKVPLRPLPATGTIVLTMRPSLPHRRRAVSLVWLALALALGVPAPALGSGGDDKDVRVRGTCGNGATSNLRLRATDGAIRVEFEVDTNRGEKRWRIVLVHERRVVWRGRARTRSGSGSLRIRRSIPDYQGADQVGVRASGPHGNTCAATGVLKGS
jgi:hypothetical protein